MTTQTSKKTSTVASLEVRIELLESAVSELTERLAAMPQGRDRGPTSTRTMTEDDAHMVCYGVRKDDSHKVAAEALGLSYAQIYSARNEYTFKQVHKANKVADVAETK